MSDEAKLGTVNVLTHPLVHTLYVVGFLIFATVTFRAGVLPRGGAPLAAVRPI